MDDTNSLSFIDLINTGYCAAGETFLHTISTRITSMVTVLYSTIDSIHRHRLLSQRIVDPAVSVTIK